MKKPNKKKIKTLFVTNNDLEELRNIIQVCKSHLGDYDIGSEDCPYNEDWEDCEKWLDILDEEIKAPYPKKRDSGHNTIIYSV